MIIDDKIRDKKRSEEQQKYQQYQQVKLGNMNTLQVKKLHPQVKEY